jgi:2-polyprenyl-3-methyl-5-hydroxy-6-metoxy-1,4-benzoquinol methylase
MNLIEKIKKKPEFAFLSNEIVKSALEDYLKKHKILLKEFNEHDEKIIIKDIRALLRKLSGQYQKSKRDKFTLLKENKINQILLTHSSTSERLAFYPKLKKKIDSLPVSSILDLGCGLNPIALASKKFIYHASDIKEDELSLIQEFFNKKGINGKTFVYDLRKFDNSQLPNVDLCLIFKVLDIIEKSPHRLTEKIITSIKCKFLLISFATKKLSGKKMNFPKRKWFERMLEKHKLQYELFESENEIFYFIKRH